MRKVKAGYVVLEEYPFLQKTDFLRLKNFVKKFDLTTSPICLLCFLVLSPICFLFPFSFVCWNEYCSRGLVSL